MHGLGTNKTHSASVVLPHFIFGALSFLAVTILLVLSPDIFSGHYFHPKLLTITHIAVLGWGIMIIFGSLYQLLPVLVEASLFSETLAKITFGIFGMGIIFMAWSFWNFYVGSELLIASILILFSFVLFAINIFTTVRKSKKQSSEIDFISTSVIWLLFTGILGLLMAINFTHPFLPKSHLLFLKIHAHLGIAGWFILLIMGVASKLIPMFLLSQNLNQKKLTAAYYLVNAGLIGFIIDIYFFEGSIILPVFGVLIVSGILCFISFVFEAYKKRLRKVLDIGLKHTFAAILVLFLPIVLGLVLSFIHSPDSVFLLRVYLVYGVSIFLGFISSLILGQTFKTLPFIVWLHNYGNRAGKGNLPLPKDLYSEKLAESQFIIYLAALLTLFAGILLAIPLLIRAGALLFLIVAVLYSINIFKIIFIKPPSLKLV